MKKLTLNRETLVRMTEYEDKLVNGGTGVGGWATCRWCLGPTFELLTRNIQECITEDPTQKNCID